MKQGVEAPPPPEVEQLTEPTKEDVHQILKCGDVLDTETKQESHIAQWEEMRLENLYRRFLKRGKRGGLYVVRNSGGKIVGFMALRASATYQTGSIDYLRAKGSGREQAAIVAKLLTAAKATLESKQCHHATLDAPHPSATLQREMERGVLKNFYLPLTPANDEARSEQEEEPDTDREAASDMPRMSFDEKIEPPSTANTNEDEGR